ASGVLRNDGLAGFSHCCLLNRLTKIITLIGRSGASGRPDQPDPPRLDLITRTSRAIDMMMIANSQEPKVLLCWASGHGETVSTLRDEIKRRMKSEISATA